MVEKYHFTRDRRVTVCGRNCDETMYVGKTYWHILKARNRCKTCLRIEPLSDFKTTASSTA